MSCHSVMQALYINEIDSPSIGKLAFGGLPQLGILSVAICGLVTAPSIQPVAYTLDELVLYKNNITSLPANYFEGCIRLSYLSLGYNGFRSIPDITGISDTLQDLDIRNNLLSDISMLYLVKFPRLSQLTLANNRIVSFPYPKLRWTRLRALDLRDNFLDSMTHQWFYNAAIPRSVEANGNPWNCSQDLCWLKSCSLVTSSDPPYYQCGTNGLWSLPRGCLKCASPLEWKGMDITVTGKKKETHHRKADRTWDTLQVSLVSFPWNHIRYHFV